MTRLFKGGIHPPSKKENTRKKPLCSLDVAPSRLVLSLACSLGKDLEPVVSVGQQVAAGQVVARPAQGEEGVPLYTGVSGKVVEIDHEPNPICGWAPSIVIENDFLGTREEHQAYPNPEELSQEQLLALIQERGLRSMSHQDSPVWTKVMEGRGKIDTLIINAAECEPYLTADYRLLLERQDLVVAGGKLLAYAMGAEKIVVAIQGDKLDALEELEKTIGWDKETMTVRTLPTCYPFGEEKQVIRFVTRREIPSQGKLHQAHCGVFNIATVYAVGEAILKGLPQTHRAITVTGGAVQRPRNLWVPIGTPFQCLVDNAGGFRENPGVVLAGGPMTGVAQQDLRVPVLVHTPGLLALGQEEIPPHLREKSPAIHPCIHCGHCLTVCPMHLSPHQIYRLMARGTPKKLAPYHPQDCMQCGCCNYRCPANLPLAETIAQAKKLFEEKPLPETDVKIYARHQVKEKKPGRWSGGEWPKKVGKEKQAQTGLSGGPGSSNLSGKSGKSEKSGISDKSGPKSKTEVQDQGEES